jgi:hypothetical protein
MEELSHVIEVGLSTMLPKPAAHLVPQTVS